MTDRRDQLETERWRLMNSYGWGAYRDGLITLRIAKIDEELLALAILGK